MRFWIVLLLLLISPLVAAADSKPEAKPEAKAEAKPARIKADGTAARHDRLLAERKILDQQREGDPDSKPEKP